MIRLSLLFLLGLMACGRGDRPARQGPFFSLEAFLDQEQAHLAAGSRVRKEVTLNQSADTLVLDAYDWAAELDLLAQWDLNRPAWFDQYRRDSLPYGTQGHIAHYSALREDLAVRECKIWLMEGRPDSLLIRTRVSNPLHTTEGRYFYQPGQRFHFRQVNIRRFGDAQSLEVSVVTLP